MKLMDETVPETVLTVFVLVKGVIHIESTYIEPVTVVVAVIGGTALDPPIYVFPVLIVWPAL